MGRHAGAARRAVTSANGRGRAPEPRVETRRIDLPRTLQRMRVAMTIIGGAYLTVMSLVAVLAHVPMPWALILHGIGLAGGVGAALPAWVMRAG